MSLYKCKVGQTRKIYLNNEQIGEARNISCGFFQGISSGSVKYPIKRLMKEYMIQELYWVTEWSLTDHTYNSHLKTTTKESTTILRILFHWLPHIPVRKFLDFSLNRFSFHFNHQSSSCLRFLPILAHFRDVMSLSALTFVN